MKKSICLVVYMMLLFPIISLAQGMEIKDTPEEYVEHIVRVWEVDREKIIFVSKETSIFKVASVLHKSMLAFVEGKLSTSAEILDGRKKVNKKACGLALNNLDLENVKRHLKKGKDYSKIRFKKLTDKSDFEFSDRITAVLVYSKKFDYVIGDYFKVLKEFSDQGLDYVLITFDDEITSQIPEALSNG